MSLLFHCLLFPHCFVEYVWPLFVVHYLVSFIVCNHLAGKERAG